MLQMRASLAVAFVGVLVLARVDIACGAVTSVAGLTAELDSVTAACDEVETAATDFLARGADPGDTTEAFLLEGCGVASVVPALLRLGGNDVVQAVVARALLVEGDAARESIRSLALSVEGIDPEGVDRALVSVNAATMSVDADPGATEEGEPPEGPVRRF